jgi:hypothetical protein
MVLLQLNNMYSHFESNQDSQHLYINSLISLLKDDIVTLIGLKKTIKKVYCSLIEEMILAKIEILAVLSLRTPILKDEDDFNLDIMNKPDFNLVEYLLDIEINQDEIFTETLILLNYSKEKRNIISSLCKRNIALLKKFHYDF